MHQRLSNGAVFSGDGPRGPAGGGQRNNAYIYRDPQKSGKWHLYFLNRENNKSHRFVLKRSDGGYPDPSAAGENEALGLAQERYIELRTRTDRGEAVRVLTVGEMVRRFLSKEERRISNRPHEGITPGRFRMIRNKCMHFLTYCSDGRGGPKKQVHLARRGFLDAYQHWREEQTSAMDKHSKKLPRSTTLNGEYSTIKSMWKEVALPEGFIPATSFLRLHTRRVRRIRPIGVPHSTLRNGCSWRRRHAPTGSKA